MIDYVAIRIDWKHLAWFVGTMVALLAYALARYAVYRRRERRIRRWADANGYAVLRLEFRRTVAELFARSEFIGRGAWYVWVQDDEGGQRAAFVRFRGLLGLTVGRMDLQWE